MRRDGETKRSRREQRSELWILVKGSKQGRNHKKTKGGKQEKVKAKQQNQDWRAENRDREKYGLNTAERGKAAKVSFQAALAWCVMIVETTHN